MMKSCSDLMRMIKSAEGMTRMVQLYGSREGEVARQMERYMLLLKRHEDLFGTEKMPLLVSAPGRTELLIWIPSPPYPRATICKSPCTARALRPSAWT